MKEKRTIIALQTTEPKTISETPKTATGDDIAKDKSDLNTPAHRNAMSRAEARQTLITIADQVAGHPQYFRNYKYKDCWKHFPSDPEMQMVDKYYPHAKGGPLLVDEPQTESQMMKAYEKQRILKKAGFRHIVIEKDSILDMCLDQLGEL